MASTQNNHASRDKTSNRGFASMDPEKQREIASKGGQAAHRKGTAHEFTSEEAREAGRKGGESRHNNEKNASASVISASGNDNRQSVKARNQSDTRKDGGYE